jgi:O-methyltransferase involved in polyketide biosynthesis
MKVRTALGAVQETMLVTLYGRALATRNGGGLLHDPRAVEIVQALDYNFRRFADESQVMGSVLRTRILDDVLRLFVVRFPRATVVEIGAGLNARFERVDNGLVRWVDVDLPDVMDLRRRFFAETARRTMLSASVLDPAWTGAVKRLGPPYVLIAEGVFGYLTEDEVRTALALIAHELPRATVAFDVPGGSAVATRKGRSVCPGLRARLRWTCEDPSQIEQWGLGYRLVESRSLSGASSPLEAPLPFSYQYTMALARILAWPVDAYRLNVYCADGKPSGKPAGHSEEAHAVLRNRSR